MEHQDPILNPTVYIGSLEWREPVTSLTDFMVALACFFAFWYLGRNKARASHTFKLYRTYFLLFAIGMTSAAWIGHAFQAYFSVEWKMIGWLCSLHGLLALAFASLYEIRPLINNKIFAVIKTGILVQYVVFLVLILSPYRSFAVAQAASAVALSAFVLPMQVFHYYRRGNKGSLMVAAAIAYGLVPGYIYNNQISVSRWFNYHDISHVLVFIFMILMTFGVRNLALVPLNQKSN